MNHVTVIVDRCHVGDSYRNVMRYLVSRLMHKERSYREMPKKDRRTLWNMVCKQHDKNRNVFKRYNF